MPNFLQHHVKSRLAVSVAILAVAAAALSFATLISRSAAQEGPATEPAADTASPKTAPKAHKPRHAVRKKAVAETAPAAAQAAAAQPAAAPPPAGPQVAAAPPAARPFDFAAQLDKAGASTCHAQINALAASTMGEVVKFNTVSNWAPDGGGKRAVSMAIGQRYADGSKVPFGVSQIVTAPNQQGSCDGLVTQILPSPLPCNQLKSSIAAHGKEIGDLAGVALLQDGNGRTMLIPTSANTCVLVTSRSLYLK